MIYLSTDCTCGQHILPCTITSNTFVIAALVQGGPNAMEDWRARTRRCIDPVVAHYATRWEDTQNLLKLIVRLDRDDPAINTDHPIIVELKRLNISFYTEEPTGDKAVLCIYAA